jgi:hypothetical protein
MAPWWDGKSDGRADRRGRAKSHKLHMKSAIFPIPKQHRTCVVSSPSCTDFCTRLDTYAGAPDCQDSLDDARSTTRRSPPSGETAPRATDSMDLNHVPTSIAVPQLKRPKSASFEMHPRSYPGQRNSPPTGYRGSDFASDNKMPAHPTQEGPPVVSGSWDRWMRSLHDVGHGLRWCVGLAS